MRQKETVEKPAVPAVSKTVQPLPIERKHQPRPQEAKRVVVVGAPEDIPRALEHPAVGAGRFDVVAVLAVAVDGDAATDLVEQLAQLLRAHEAETILVAGSVGWPAMRRVADVALAHQCELLAVMPTEVPAGHDPVIVWSGDSPLVQLALVKRRAWEFAAKRTMDVVGAAVGLVVIAPVVLVLCTLVSMESRGWPIFAHERVGLRGKKFKCLKLRTMRVGAEDELRSDPEMYEEYRRHHYKIPEDSDPRTTRLGKFLRRTSLDEVPQLWNVLIGEMSLVGPRPVVQDELGEYGEFADLLLSVRPGLTGAWAVGGRHDVGYPERCDLELGYVRKQSLGRDVSILLRTARAVVLVGGKSEV